MLKQNHINLKLKKPGTTLSLVLIIVFIITIFIFCFIGNKILSVPETKFDVYAFDQLKKITNATNTRLMVDITFFGSRTFLFPAYILLSLYFLFAMKDIIIAIYIAITGGLGNEIWISMQQLFHRSRPLDPLIQKITDYGYPSGHSFSAFTFFGLLIYFTWQSALKKSWKIIFSIILLIAPVLIAISRVYLHMHFITDVIGGCCLAVAWLIMSTSLLVYYRQKFFYKKEKFK